MKTSTKIIIGGVAVATAYFLWDRSKKKKAGLLTKSPEGGIVTSPIPAISPNKPMPTEVALDKSGIAPIVKDSYAQDQRNRALAEAEYAKQLAETERARLAEQGRVMEQARLDELARQEFDARQSATIFRLAEEKRLADERAGIEERERIANQERLFLMEEEIRNRKNQAIRDTTGSYNQRYLDGVDNDFNRGMELFAV
jgi:hypothetical protein